MNVVMSFWWVTSNHQECSEKWERFLNDVCYVTVVITWVWWRWMKRWRCWPYIDPTRICTVKCKRVMFLSVYRLTRYLSVLCFACTVEKVTSCTLTARLLAFCILGLFKYELEVWLLTGTLPNLALCCLIAWLGGFLSTNKLKHPRAERQSVENCKRRNLRLGWDS